MPYNDLMYLLKLAHRYLCTSNWVNTLKKKIRLFAVTWSELKNTLQLSISSPQPTVFGLIHSHHYQSHYWCEGDVPPTETQTPLWSNNSGSGGNQNKEGQ